MNLSPSGMGSLLADDPLAAATAQKAGSLWLLDGAPTRCAEKAPGCEMVVTLKGN